MNQNKGLFAGPVVMLLSAAMFGFFGFSRDWSAPFPDGKVILFMVVLGWTLRLTACVFLLSGLLAFARPVAGNLLYSLAGVASAGLFVVVAVMDVTDTDHMIMRYGVVLLLLFSAWNGFGSWSALPSILVSREHNVPATGSP